MIVIRCTNRSRCSADTVRSFTNLRAAIPPLPIMGTLVAAWLVLSASAVVYAVEHIQRRIPDGLAIPGDAEVVTDRAIGSTVRMFSIATGTDVDAIDADWQQCLCVNGYAVTQGTGDLLDLSIEFFGPGIGNTKIIVAPSTETGRSIIEFDATLDLGQAGARFVAANSRSGSTPRFSALARTAT
ncbi:hypothetical protein PVV74_19135 [Roseovarius sp. SK2]|uniref:hypothetical protein n=1 Tax=Roseovarius sp. SK2 TaxID=3028381 RepID=UPI00237B2736|nr:hypothetical protein [Roseovarius sp. SK2]MDD9727571.1 hypothetical protein [Roseovarius sp. SK2]